MGRSPCLPTLSATAAAPHKCIRQGKINNNYCKSKIKPQKKYFCFVNSENIEKNKNLKNPTHDGCGLQPYVLFFHACAREQVLAQLESPSQFQTET